MANCAVVFFLTSGVVASMALIGATPSRGGQALSPEWRTDLRPTVRSEPVRPIISGQESVGRPASSLWFTDNNTIVATFVIREDGGHPRVSRRGNQDASLPLRLRAMFIDAGTGKITSTRDWATDSRTARVVAVHEGRLVTLARNQLTLYLPDFTPAKSITLPSSGLLDWFPHTSPSGRNILFSSAELRKGAWIWVETDSLKILSSWEDSPSGYLTISDEDMATSTCWGGYECSSITVNANGGSACWPGPKCESNVQIRELSTHWRTVAPGEKYQLPQFVNDDMMFLPGKDSGKLIGIDGKVILDEPKADRSWGCWDTGVVPAAYGRRFIIPSCLWKGAVKGLDISSHPVLKQVFVYDIGPQIHSKTLEVKGPKIQNEMLFAISPDGSKLAILSDEFVETFALPPSN